jgi:DNA-binding NarL/FixJ family response regulator
MTTISVMLVDDHAVVRDGLRALLESSPDIKVVGVAGTGREALAEVQRLSPDVVIMDIALPEMDGVQATRHVMEKCPETRVLILSMYLSSEHIHRALQAGAKGYVLKESAGEEVTEAVRALSAGKRYLSYRITETMIQDYVREGTPISLLDSLSLRERDVLQMVVEGGTNASIALKLSLSPKTVETYRARIIKKLKVKDTVELVKFAMRHGIVS